MRWRIKPGFLLQQAMLLAVLPWQIDLALLGLCAAHEAAHLLALRLLRVRVRSLTLCFWGAALDTELLTTRQTLLTATAGPAVNLLLALLPLPSAYRALSLLLGLFNLLPVLPLDGGQILYAVLERICTLPERVVRAVEGAVLFAVISAALAAGMQSGMGLLPLCGAGVLVMRLLAEKYVATTGDSR